jgi:hypothetical protein
MRDLTLVWPGGEHSFALRLGELEAVQDKCDAGPEYILNRIRLGNWKTTDLFEVIRFGLIGGGMKPGEALKITRQAFERHGIAEFKLTAMTVLFTALYGPEDDPPGESAPVSQTTPD